MAIISHTANRLNFFIAAQTPSSSSSSAEANFLKYKELLDQLDEVEQERWKTIQETFVKNNKLKGFGNKNEMAQILSQMRQFSDNLEGIKQVLQKGLEKN